MKLKIFLLAFSIVTLSNAQTEKGTKFIGGDFSVNYTKNTTNYETIYSNSENKNTRINITPQFGYFIKNNLAIGSSLTYFNSNSESTSYIETQPLGNVNKSTINGFGVNLFANYYKPIIGQLFFLANANIGYSNSKGTYSNSSSEAKNNSKTNSYSVSINPGFVYFINSKFSLNYNLLNIGYNYNKSKETNNLDSNVATQKSNAFYAGLSTNILNLGLNYYFK